MKQIIYIITLFTIGLISCSEDKLNIEPQDPRYDLSDSETDALQHYKHEFFEKYNVIVIDDVDTSDYQYTISGKKLDLEMDKSTKTDEEKIAFLEILENTFFKNYSQEFIQQFFPVRLIIADTIGRMVDEWWMEEPEFKHVPVYISKSLVAISTNADDFTVKDGIAYSINEWGDEENIGDQLISTIVIDNILEARYGENWDQLFLPMFGIIRPHLYYNDWNQTFDAGFQIIFGDEYYDPNDPDNLFNRPLSEYPGVHEENPENQNEEAIVAYMNKLGFPGCGRVYFYDAQPPQDWDPDGSPAMGKLKIWIEELIPLWIGWAAKYDESERLQLFDTYPELRKNYLTTKELLQKYAGIEI